MLLIVLFGFISNAFTQNSYDAIHLLDREIGFGTRPLAMGGAFSGLADDYTAIYWNPAGLGSIKMPGIYSELSHLNFENQAAFLGNLNVDNQSFTRLGSFGLVYPVATTRGSFVWAIGYNRILDFDENLYFKGLSGISNDLGFSFDDDSTLHYFDGSQNGEVYRNEHIQNEGGLRLFSIGGALALSPKFTIGVTFGLLGGIEEYRLQFTQVDSENNYTEYPGDFDEYQVTQILRSDIQSFSIKLGGMIHLARGLKMGGVITFPSVYQVDEVHSFSDKLVFDDGFTDQTEDTGEWFYKIKSPFIFDYGLSYGNSLFTLAASGRYRDWSQTRFIVEKYDYDDEDYREFLEENIYIRTDYRPTFEYHLGGELNVSILNTKLRAGYALYPTPRKHLFSGDEDRKVISGGLSIRLDQAVNLELTFVNTKWSRFSSDNFTPGGVDEKINTNQLLIGFSYSF